MAQRADGGYTPQAKKVSAPGPRNAQEAIAAQANSKRAAANSVGTRAPGAPSYGGGPLTQNVQNYRPSSGGTYGTNQSAPTNRMGYEAGGFSDPTIDWTAIYNAMIAPGLGGGDSGGGGFGTSDTSGGGGLQSIAPPVPMVMESPASISAPSIQMPAVVNSAASSVANAPEGQKFTTFGGPSTFGGFERQRNQRGPMHNASMTPEMLRRAAASRLG